MKLDVFFDLLKSGVLKEEAALSSEAIKPAELRQIFKCLKRFKSKSDTGVALMLNLQEKQLRNHFLSGLKDDDCIESFSIGGKCSLEESSILLSILKSNRTLVSIQD